MAAWQGPALCCYNDAVFTAADLRAISRIGQDSKLDKPEATGRLGLHELCNACSSDVTCSSDGTVGCYGVHLLLCTFSCHGSRHFS